MTQNNYNNLEREFVSGLVSGFVSATITAPLDVARTRLNIMKTTKMGQ